MEYSYNGNLLAEDRIIEVAKDIQKEYPEISFELAKNIATLEAPITTEANDEIRFRRLYNILFFTQNNTIVKKKVIDDLIPTYQRISGQYEDIDQIMANMIPYIITGDLFPYYS